MHVLLDARQRQQIIDEARHPLRLLAHDAEEFVAGDGVLARRTLQGFDKPSSEARRAQLVVALATKSTRMRSTRRDSVRSRKPTMAAASNPSICIGAICASNQHSTGRRSTQTVFSASPPASTRDTASSMSGDRRLRDSGSPGRMAGERLRAALTAATWVSVDNEDRPGAR
jgi:hypothetical protein